MKHQIKTLLLCLALTEVQAQTVTIPFHTQNRLILVEASIDGVSGNLIIDTGIPEVILNAAYFKGKDLDSFYQGVSDRTINAQLDFVDIEISGIQWKSTVAKIIPLQHLETQLQEKLLGCLGSNFFKTHTLTINFATNELVLSSPGLASLALVPDESFSFKIRNGIPFVTANVGDRKIELGLDTGTSINVLHERWIPKLKDHFTYEDAKYIIGISEKAVLAKIIRLKDVMLEQQQLPAQLFFAIDLYSKEENQQHIFDGLIHPRFFGNNQIAIDFQARLIHIWYSDEPPIAEKMDQDAPPYRIRY